MILSDVNSLKASKLNYSKKLLLQHYHNGYARLYRFSQINVINVKYYLNMSRQVLFDNHSDGKREKWWKCVQNPEKVLSQALYDW